ncbi:hypothetical protein [Thermoflexibacter ruber]|uniref:hypothetical protein n=1 Tax=Thermoflexibacter ruber TaxID=1003 RepID=UPI000B8287BC|nr:hypothetical protein [Thermoflexibacter ruber]
MIKSILSLLLFGIIATTACTSEKVNATLAAILYEGGGTWKVTYAKFGDEEAPRGMYDRFTIQFRNNGTYVVVNPDGSVIFTPSLLGNWKEGSNNTIIFDGTVIVRELKNLRTANKLVFEWEVNIPGKVTTTYRIELIKA